MKRWLLLGILILLIVPFISARSLSISIDTDTRYALNLNNGDSQNVQFSVNAEQYSCSVNCIWKLYDLTNSRTVDFGSDITRSNTPFYKTFTLTAPAQGSGAVEYLFSASCNEITGEGHPDCNGATQGTAEDTTMLYYSPPEVETCSPSWNCDGWSNCVNSARVRICNDGCGKTKTESEFCCIPSWNCNQWSNANNECGARTCNDLNGCDVTTGKPLTSKFCPTPQCYPDWICSQWSNINQGCGSRTCTDANKCGTNNEKPIISKSCPVQCSTSWSCNQWSDINQQCGSRTCTDINGCGTNVGKPITSNTCPAPVVIETKQNTIEQPTQDTHDMELDSLPIVFVHGWTGNKNSFEEFEKKIKWDTQIAMSSDMAKAETYEVAYSNTTCNDLAEYGIREHALLLQKEVDKARASSRYYKVNIIAHSMGGLTARYYIKYLGGNETVNKLIMLGTPNHGASRFLGGLFSSCYQDKSLIDLDFDSQFLEELNKGDETYGDVRYYTIYTSSDGVVISGVQLEGAKNYEDTKCHATWINGIYKNNGHENLIIPSNCNLAYTQTLDALKVSQDNKEKINPPIQQQTQSPITGNAIAPQEKVCIKKFLWWCIRWE